MLWPLGSRQQGSACTLPHCSLQLLLSHLQGWDSMPSVPRCNDTVVLDGQGQGERLRGAAPGAGSCPRWCWEEAAGLQEMGGG